MHIRLPHISIIVPCYNSETTIERCVYSILAQTYCDFEIILVDDGSKDRTGDLCNHLALGDNRIRVIHKQNGGVSSARNAGIEIAKGKYLTFCDSDDEVLPNWLTAFIGIIGQKDLAIQGIKFIGEHFVEKTIGVKSGSDNRSLILTLTGEYYLGYLVGKCFRRDIIEKYHIRFDERIRFREDDVFMLEYAIHTNNWASTEASNYIYYVPSEEKKYGTAATDCTEKILNSLNVIFAGDIPRSILANQAWSVKGAVVSQILAGHPVSPILLDAYRRTFSYNRSLKQRTLNFLILNSASLGPIPRTILRLVNR